MSAQHDLDAQRKRFMAMLQDAEAEGERDGFVEIVTVLEELDAIIAEAVKAHTR